MSSIQKKALQTWSHVAAKKKQKPNPTRQTDHIRVKKGETKVKVTELFDIQEREHQFLIYKTIFSNSLKKAGFSASEKPGHGGIYLEIPGSVNVSFHLRPGTNFEVRVEISRDIFDVVYDRLFTKKDVLPVSKFIKLAQKYWKP